MLAGSERIVFPLDVASLSEARAWLARLSGHVGVMKVGLELFSRAGPDAVRAVHEAGSTCFLDLKLHDIPETVARAASAAAEIGVAFLTVHASGGAAMLDRARRAVAGARTTLLAVTVLTSLDAAQLEAVGLAGPPREAVLRLARLARDSGCGGLVASPLELSALRADLGPELVIATPGVRPAGSAQHDQRRVATPAEATRAGASLLVIGRPIRDAPDPVAAAAAIANEIAGALG